MMTQLLAQAADTGGDHMTGAWVTGLIVAVITAIFAGFKGGMAKRQSLTLEEPVPTVPTSKVYTPPTWDAHRAVCDRVSRLEEAFGEMRREQASQYKDMMQATNGLETRLGSKLDVIAREIHERIDRRIDQTVKPRMPRP